MKSWHEFVTMGGYAQYVWPAYAVGVIVFIWNAWSALRGYRQAIDRAKRRSTRQREESQ